MDLKYCTILFIWSKWHRNTNGPSILVLAPPAQLNPAALQHHQRL